MKIYRVTLPILVGAALLCGSASAGERQSVFAVTDAQLQAMGIQTSVLQKNAEPVVLNLPAQVLIPANGEQIVSSPITGLLSQLFIQTNQALKQGAPVAKIISTELGTLQLQFMQAHSRAKLARQAQQREQSLFDEGIIARRRLHEAEAALGDAEAALQQARSALQLAGLSTNDIDSIAVTGKLKDSITLAAPVAGLVASIDIKVGQRVEPTTVLAHLVQTDRLLLEIQAPGSNASMWRVGSPLSVQGRAGSARITSVSPVVTGGSQTVAIRAAVEGGSDLRPGEFVTVRLQLPASSISWDIALGALVHHGSDTFVFVRNGGNVEARQVKVLESAGQRVRIQGELKAGDKIAVTGVVALKGSWLGEKGGS